MQITCTICTDLFVPGATVCTTKCGHLFHIECLLQWLDRSKTCPQCRAEASEKNVIRIFFNNLASEDSNTLQNKVDSLEFQMRLKEHEVKKLKDELLSHQKKSEGHIKEVKRLQDDVRSAESNFNCLKEQFGIMKKRNKELESAKQESENLWKQITHMKKELTSVTAKKNELTSKLGEAESKVYSLSFQLVKLKVEAEEDARHADNKRSSLQRKVRRHGGCKGCRGSKGALRRLQRESPAPSAITPPTPCPFASPADSEQTGIPTVAAAATFSDLQAVQQEDAEPEPQDMEASSRDQTPLRAPRSIDLDAAKIQPRSIAISANSGIAEKLSIFRKASRINSLTLRRDGMKPGLGSGFSMNVGTRQGLGSSEGEVYDGFGGHSKPDFFPRPILQGKVKKNLPRVHPVHRIKLKDATNSLVSVTLKFSCEFF